MGQRLLVGAASPFKFKDLKRVYISFLFLINLFFNGCSSDDPQAAEPELPGDDNDYYFGVDLSYVNQILDYGGEFRDNGVVQDPYSIFADAGANLARFRLWHNPVWTKEVYEPDGVQMYNDVADVTKSITRAKASGMDVLLDFHYADRWADPGAQPVPAAWRDISALDILADSVYEYTKKTLTHLKANGLLPTMVQLGNETNCGMLYSDVSTSFPAMNVCDGNWANLGVVLNAAIRAVREVTVDETKIILHVADPKNIEWWFDNVISRGAVHDFDIIGISYYPLWHTTVTLENISNRVSSFKRRFQKDVMILETAYPWTMESADSYNNVFGDDQPLSGFPFTQQGQHDFMVKLNQEVIDGGGIGVIYWEPAWITSNMKDLWGTGSSWENVTLFDFEGNRHKGMDYMKFAY